MDQQFVQTATWVHKAVIDSTTGTLALSWLVVKELTLDYHSSSLFRDPTM